MRSSLAVFVCLFAPMVACAQPPAPAVEQLPSMPKRAIVPDAAVEPLPGTPKSAVVQDAAAPCQSCGASHAMPYLDSHWPPFYRPAYSGGDWGRSPNALGDRGRLTWWFIPTPRALIQAICP